MPSEFRTKERELEYQLSDLRRERRKAYYAILVGLFGFALTALVIFFITKAHERNIDWLTFLLTLLSVIIAIGSMMVLGVAVMAAFANESQGEITDKIREAKRNLADHREDHSLDWKGLFQPHKVRTGDDND